MRRPVEEAELGFQRGNTSFRLRPLKAGLERIWFECQLRQIPETGRLLIGHPRQRVSGF